MLSLKSLFATLSTTQYVISCADSSETLATSGKTPSKESPSPPSDASTGPSPPQADSGSLDVAYFRKIHSDVTARLMELCQEWEEKSASLEEQEDVSEDGRDTVVPYWLECKEEETIFQYRKLVSFPAHVCLPVRNGLVNKVEFLGLTQKW